MMRRLLLALLASLFVASPVDATVIFSEDYEVTMGDVVNASSPPAVALAAKGWDVSNLGNCNPADGYTGDVCIAAIVACPTGRAGRCLRYQYQGLDTNDAHNANLIRVFSPVPEFYERYYVKLDKIDPTQTYGWRVSGKQHYWKSNGPGSNPSFVLESTQGSSFWQYASQTESPVNCPLGQPDVACNNYANLAQPTMLDGQWHCVEGHIKLNTAGSTDGQMDVWIDGTHTASYTGPNSGNWRVLASPTAAIVQMEVYRQGADNMYRYEDDLVVATTRVGCAGVPGTMTVFPTSLSFAKTVGQPNPPSQVVTVTVSSGAWSTHDSMSYINVTGQPFNGVDGVTGTGTGTFNAVPSAGMDSLPVGVTHGNILINASNGAPDVNIPITVTVSPSGPPPPATNLKLSGDMKTRGDVKIR